MQLSRTLLSVSSVNMGSILSSYLSRVLSHIIPNVGSGSMTWDSKYYTEVVGLIACVESDVLA